MRRRMPRVTGAPCLRWTAPSRAHFRGAGEQGDQEAGPEESNADPPVSLSRKNLQARGTRHRELTWRHDEHARR
jgi:hypothetical protein